MVAGSLVGEVTMTVIRILIVDDHEVVRRGLEMVLKLEPDLDIVGEAVNGPQAIEQAKLLRPDLVLLDLKMPGMGGALAARGIKHVSPRTHVLILTGVDVDHEIMTALESNVDGYILKDAPSSELLHAIHVIMGGEAYLQPAVTKRLLRRMAATSASEPVMLPPQLTPRELEVLKLLSTSRSNKEIAEVLVVTEETVRSHTKSILHKLGQPNRTQAVLAALRMHLIELD
jgi:DNA-binding NarL/FixJ family response regulator